MRGIVFDGKQARLETALEVREPGFENAIAALHAAKIRVRHPDFLIF